MEIKGHRTSPCRLSQPHSFLIEDETGRVADWKKHSIPSQVVFPASFTKSFMLFEPFLLFGQPKEEQDRSGRPGGVEWTGHINFYVQDPGLFPSIATHLPCGLRQFAV